MNIKLALLCACLAFAFAGCAFAPVRGGGEGPEGYTESQGQDRGDSQPTDYRQVLADPGPF